MGFNMMEKKFAFTLAQNLLVMGIVFLFLIFVVFIPFYNNFQLKKSVVTYRTVYSKLLEANRMYAIIDSQEQDVYDTSLPINTFAETYFTPYLSIANYCKGDQSGCWNSPLYKDLKNTKYFNKSLYTIVLDDSTILGFHKEPKKNLVSVIVDTNGLEGRNTLGQDVFVFSFYNNKIRPKLCKASVYENAKIKDGIHFGGYDDCGIPYDTYDYKDLTRKDIPDGCSKKSEESKYGFGVGAACGALLYKNLWVIDNNYPW